MVRRWLIIETTTETLATDTDARTIYSYMDIRRRDRSYSRLRKVYLIFFAFFLGAPRAHLQ